MCREEDLEPKQHFLPPISFCQKKTADWINCLSPTAPWAARVGAPDHQTDESMSKHTMTLWPLIKFYRQWSSTCTLTEWLPWRIATSCLRAAPARGIKAPPHNGEADLLPPAATPTVYFCSYECPRTLALSSARRVFELNALSVNLCGLLLQSNHSGLTPDSSWTYELKEFI